VHLEKSGAHAAHLGMLVIQPTLQNRGLGRILLAAAENHARTEWNANRINMLVIAMREELIAYYERRGYRRTGATEPFPTDPRFGLPKVGGLSLIAMEKPLTQGAPG
ncbi:MAG: GNAT family N-acetyltransferase, partial [Gallionellaceae bacterium]|nr:GNAT family N-acetyltransferase [Gallionellaceae bacterium]